MSHTVLKVNQKAVEVNVTLGNGKHTRLSFRPHELAADDSGVVRALNIQYADGSHCNCLLTPDDMAVHETSAFMNHWLVRFGISVAGSRLVAGKSAVVNIAKFIATTVAGDVASAFLNKVDAHNSSYREVSSHEQVIVGAIVLLVRNSPDWR